jgi:hypothetical protein
LASIEQDTPRRQQLQQNVEICDVGGEQREASIGEGLAFKRAAGSGRRLSRKTLTACEKCLLVMNPDNKLPGSMKNRT